MAINAKAARAALNAYYTAHDALYKSPHANIGQAHNVLTQRLNDALTAAGFTTMKDLEIAEYNESLPGFKVHAPIKFIDLSGLAREQVMTRTLSSCAQRLNNTIPDTAMFWFAPPTQEPYLLAPKNCAAVANAAALNVKLYPNYTSKNVVYLFHKDFFVKLYTKETFTNNKALQKVADTLCLEILSNLGVADVKAQGNNYIVGGKKVATSGGVRTRTETTGIMAMSIYINWDFDAALADALVSPETLSDKVTSLKALGITVDAGLAKLAVFNALQSIFSNVTTGLP